MNRRIWRKWLCPAVWSWRRQWLCPSLWSLWWRRQLQPSPLWLRPLPGGPRIWEWWDWNRNGHSYGPEGPEYDGYESEGLKYGRYELEGFKHPGYEPRSAEFEGTTGGDIENVENKSQRLGFEPDRETQGRYTHPADVPRMQQRSVEIGDLSVYPMWFWGVWFWSSEMVSWRSIKECKVVQDGGSEWCDEVKGVGSTR